MELRSSFFYCELSYPLNLFLDSQIFNILGEMVFLTQTTGEQSWSLCNYLSNQVYINSQFLHGSNQITLQSPSCLTVSISHRGTHYLSKATRHRTEHPHTMSQWGISRNADCLDQRMTASQLKLGCLGEKLRGLGQEAMSGSTHLLEGT